MAKLTKPPPQAGMRMLENNTLARTASAESLLISGSPIYPALPRNKLIKKKSNVAQLEEPPNSLPDFDPTWRRSIPTYPEVSKLQSSGTTFWLQEEAPDLLPATFESSRRLSIPTFSDGSKLQTSISTNNLHETHALTIPRKPMPKSSRAKLNAVIERKPQICRPRPQSTTSITLPIKVTENTEDDDAITSLPTLPAQEPSTRTSTMSTASTQSHQEPGPIYICPSAQLQGMQRLNPAPHLKSQGAGLRIHRSSGTSESSSDTAIERNHVREAHSRLEQTLSRPSSSEHIGKMSSKNSSEWVAPAPRPEKPTEWIEDFLLRREEADRAEAEEERRKSRQGRSLRRRVSSMDKYALVRKLSSKTVDAEPKRSFEARQERLNTIDSVLESGEVRTSMPVGASATQRRARRLSFEKYDEEELKMTRSCPSRSSPKRVPSPPPLPRQLQLQLQPQPQPQPQPIEPRKPLEPASILHTDTLRSTLPVKPSRPQKTAPSDEPPRLHRTAGLRAPSVSIHPMAMPQPHQPKNPHIHTHNANANSNIKSSSFNRLHPNWASYNNLREEVRRSCSTNSESVRRKVDTIGGSFKGRVERVGGSLKGKVERAGGSLSGRMSSLGSRERRDDGGSERNWLQRGGVGRRV